MESKRMIWLSAGLGSFIGGMIPNLWGAGAFSVSGLLFSGAGAIAGIWVMFKMTHY